MFLEAAGGTLRVRLKGEFRLEESRRLAEAFDAFGPVSRVVVDFSGAHATADASLSLFAKTLSSLPCELSVNGLTLHQARVLRYLGVVEATP